MFAGKAMINGHIFYFPLYPCVQDFASLPAISIPVAQAPVDIQTSIGNLVRGSALRPCDHKVYNFFSAPLPFSHQLHLPVIR
jgi:hypothetical protein